MTRKDYILIAETLRGLLADIERESAPMAVCDRTRALMAGEHLGVRHVAMRLGDQLRQDNPRFDRTRFIEACGLTA
jgi:hypothetical protein